MEYGMKLRLKLLKAKTISAGSQNCTKNYVQETSNVIIVS